MAKIKERDFMAEAQVETQYGKMVAEAVYHSQLITLKTSNSSDAQEIDLTHDQAEELIQTIKKLMEKNKTHKNKP